MKVCLEVFYLDMYYNGGYVLSLYHMYSIGLRTSVKVLFICSSLFYSNCVCGSVQVCLVIGLSDQCVVFLMSDRLYCMVRSVPTMRWTYFEFGSSVLVAWICSYIRF
jgi:hypothetical protein